MSDFVIRMLVLGCGFVVIDKFYGESRLWWPPVWGQLAAMVGWYLLITVLFDHFERTRKIEERLDHLAGKF